MLRNYVIFLVVVGVFSSMLGNCGGRMNRAPAGVATAAAQTSDSSASRYASDQSQPSADGLVLQRQWDGHFYADTEINGASLHMLVDTGASGIALTRDDARKAGIGISIGMPNVVGEGAGGAVKGEYVTIDRIRLGNESATKVPAVVLDGGGQSLLGQSFLQQFASVEIKGDTMVLR